MNQKHQLESKGYTVGTRSVGMESLCSIELDGKVRTPGNWC